MMEVGREELPVLLHAGSMIANMLEGQIKILPPAVEPKAESDPKAENGKRKEEKLRKARKDAKRKSTKEVAVLAPRVCENKACGKTYTPRRKDQRYCCGTCSGIKGTKAAAPGAMASERKCVARGGPNKTTAATCSKAWYQVIWNKKRAGEPHAAALADRVAALKAADRHVVQNLADRPTVKDSLETEQD